MKFFLLRQSGSREITVDGGPIGLRLAIRNHGGESFLWTHGRARCRLGPGS